MTRIGATTPETLKVVLDVVQYLRQSGFVIKRPGRELPTPIPASPIYVRNDSGLEVPPFACMQSTGTVDAGGQNYITIDQPADDDGSSGFYLFNSLAPIEIDGYGLAYDGPVVRVLTDGSTITSGDFWTPQVDDWEVTTGGGPFQAIGADDIETDVMRAYVMAEGGHAVFLTPGGGIPARSGATLGSATCTRFTVTGGTRATTGNTYTVYNDFLSAVSGSVDVIAVKINGIWVVVAEDCP